MCSSDLDQGAAGDLMQMRGSTLAFAQTRVAREKSGDPRPSVEERYASREAYLEAVRVAAKQMVTRRHALGEDVEAMVERAKLRWDFLRSA